MDDNTYIILYSKCLKSTGAHITEAPLFLWQMVLQSLK